MARPPFYKYCCCGLLALALGSCSSPVATDKTPEKPPEAISGLSALYKMYTNARTWSPDLKIMKLTSLDVPGLKQQGGKAGAWQAEFVSQTLQQTRVYTYSVVEVSVSMHQGIRPDTATNWSGHGNPFPIEAAKKDSDECYQTALKKPQAAEYNTKNPGMTISVVLEPGEALSSAHWRIIWGENASSSSFSSVIDASTGQYLETLH